MRSPDGLRTLQKFKNESNVSNFERVVRVLLQARSYSFEDPKTNKVLSGVSFTFTDGIAAEGENNVKGVNVQKLSISMQQAYKSLNKIETPSYGVFLDIRFG